MSLCDLINEESRREKRKHHRKSSVGYYIPAPQRETKGGCLTKKANKVAENEESGDDKRGAGEGGGGCPHPHLI